MPLIPPALDDRSYDDLVQEMLASIPAHAPEWTSPQPGDPGRTLIELFAWLADAVLYRANLVPEKQRLAFLKLLGQPLRPAAAARGLLALASDPAKKDIARLVKGAVVPGPVPFESLGEIDVLPVAGQAYVKAPLSPDELTASLPLRTGLRTLYKMGVTPGAYRTTPLFANNSAFAAGIDLSGAALDGCLWIALLAPKPENRAAIRDALGGNTVTQPILNVGLVPSLAPPDPLADIGPRAAIQATWQMSLATPSGRPINYATLKVIDDTTQGITRPGVVRLQLPQAADIGAPPNDVRSDAQAGVGAKPPRIDDPGIDDVLVAWVRLSASSPLRLSWAGINAVEIDQRTSFASVVIGVSDGSGNQQFALPQAQVDPATFQLEIDMPGLGYQTWQAVDDLGVAQPAAPVYRLDPEAGTVAFGDQVRGMIPPAGRRIRVALMRAGGGAAGNLPSGSLSRIQAKDPSGNTVASLTVQQPLPTSGGADAESLDQAERRIPAMVRHAGRAVTADDYRSLALEAPGAQVERAEVLPLFKPQTRTPGVPGVVSVMVLPGKEGVQPPCPRADRPLLETVYQYLDARRPAAAELYVIGSEYIGLGLSVAVEVRAGFGLLAVSQQVEDALRRYLWPLAPGGSDRQGWPLGRGVRSLELEVIASQVPGVVEVNGLNLFQLQSGGGYLPLPVDSSGKSVLPLAAWQLPELLQVVVATGADGSGVSAPTGLTPPLPTDDTVAVPVVPRVC